MKAYRIMCAALLVVMGLVFASCTSTSRYVASADDIEKFEKKENFQQNKHRNSQE